MRKSSMLYTVDISYSSMLLVSIVLSTISSIGGDAGNHCTTCVKVDKTCYNITRLLELKAPFQDTVIIKKMGILRSRNILYYSFDSSLYKNGISNVGYVNLDNHEEMGVLATNRYLNFAAFDIDQANEFIYLGGCSGIYVLETKGDDLLFFSSRDDEIQDVVYKGNVYFIIKGDSKIRRKKGDSFEVYFESVGIKNFVITKSDVLVHLNSFGLFATKRNVTVLLSKNAFFRGITIDLDGVVYAWWIDEVYRVNLNTNLCDSKLERIAYLPNLGSMVFDNDNNIIFSSDEYLYGLTKTNAATVC